MVQALNHATASASALRYAGNVLGNAASGLAGALASEGLMKLMDPKREVDWAHVAAMGAGMGGGMSLLSRPAKYVPARGEKESFVLNVSGNRDVQNTSFALLQKPGRFNLDSAALAAGAGRRMNGDSKLIIPGHGGNGTLDGKTPQEMAAFLRDLDVREVGPISLVACGFSPTGSNQRSYAEDLAEALAAQGIKFKSISARDGRVAVLPDGRKVVVDGNDNIYSKGQGTKYVVQNQRDENGNFIVDRNPYAAPGTLRDDLDVADLTLLPGPEWRLGLGLLGTLRAFARPPLRIIGPLAPTPAANVQTLSIRKITTSLPSSRIDNKVLAMNAVAFADHSNTEFKSFASVVSGSLKGRVNKEPLHIIIDQADLRKMARDGMTGVEVLAKQLNESGIMDNVTHINLISCNGAVPNEKNTAMALAKLTKKTVTAARGQVKTSIIDGKIILRVGRMETGSSPFKDLAVSQSLVTYGPNGQLLPTAEDNAFFTAVLRGASARKG